MTGHAPSTRCRVSWLLTYEEESQRRTEAETRARAAEETAQRQELERQFAELQARLQERGD